MTGSLRLETTLERRTEEGEVAQHIEHLVANGLIDGPEAAGIQHAVLTEDQRVVQTASANKSHSPHCRNMPLEPKGPGPGELPREGTRCERELELLTTDMGVFEVTAAATPPLPPRS